MATASNSVFVTNADSANENHMDPQQPADEEPMYSHPGTSVSPVITYPHQSHQSLPSPTYTSGGNINTSNPGPNHNRAQIYKEQRNIKSASEVTTIDSYPASSGQYTQNTVFQGYIYPNGMMYQNPSFNGGIQSPQRLTSADSSLNKQMQSLQMNPSHQGYFTPRTPPNGRINPRTPISSPLHQSTSSYPFGAIPSAATPVQYYNPNNTRMANTPNSNASRRYTAPSSSNQNIAFSINSHQLLQHQQGSYFMTGNAVNFGSGIGHSRRLSDTIMGSPVPFRRQQRELSISGASGVDWESEGISQTNIYIKGLKNSTTDDDLYNMCKVFGAIHSSKAILDLTTHECKGFGFVMYESIADAQFALTELSKLGYNVSFAKETFNTRLKNLQDEESTNIYVSNLPVEMDEEGMLTLFTPHTVISTKILRDPATQLSRGVGFARMDSRNAATAVINEFNGMMLESGQCLQVRFADSPAQKKFKSLQQVGTAQPSLGRTSIGSSQTSLGRSWQAGGNTGADSMSSHPMTSNHAGDASGVDSGSLGESAIGAVDVAAVGYVPYYDGYVPNGVMISPMGAYPYSIAHQQYPTGPTGTTASATPHLMYGTHYYPHPAGSNTAGHMPTSQQTMMFPGHPHQQYMLPVHAMYPAPQEASKNGPNHQKSDNEPSAEKTGKGSSSCDDSTAAAGTNDMKGTSDESVEALRRDLDGLAV
ncbi:hypothetical protein HDU80_009979 [Chytriomyces hyalinus]|nr:hypothetical protein HDU80_009979 [Chytriomyces hyalinus]